MSASPDSLNFDIDSESETKEQESWLLYFDYAGTLQDLLDDIDRLCERCHSDEILKEVCVPIDFPLLAESQPMLAHLFITDIAGCIDAIASLLCSATTASIGRSPLPGQLLVLPRIFQFPGAAAGVASAKQMRTRLGRLSCLDCQIVCVDETALCDRAIRFECRDPQCPAALVRKNGDCNENNDADAKDDDDDDDEDDHSNEVSGGCSSLMLQRRPGYALATAISMPESASGAPSVPCPACGSDMSEIAAGRVQSPRLLAIALPNQPASSGVRRPIRCVAIGNRLIRQLALGRRCRLIGLPVADTVGQGCHFEIVDCEPVLSELMDGPDVRPLHIQDDLSGSRYGAALHAAFYLCADASPPGSWMTVKLAILMQLLAAVGDDQYNCVDEAERLRPVSLCIMSPGDYNSVHCLLQSLTAALGDACVVHRSGVPVAAALAAKLPWWGPAAQAAEAGTLALAGPGNLAVFPYLAGMRTPDLHSLAWAMEAGMAAAPNPPVVRSGPPLLCGILGLLERAACGRRVAPEADGCYGNDQADVDDQLSSMGLKRELLGVRPELRSLLSRFRLYIECEEPDHEAAAAHRLTIACGEGEELRAKSSEVVAQVLSQRHRPCQLDDAAAETLQRHFMAGRRVFEAKRLSFGLDSMATLTALAAGHARLNCRSTVLTEDVVLAAYLLEVSAYCLLGSSHFSISYLGHLQQLDARVAEEFDACLNSFQEAVKAFMDKDLPVVEE